MKILVTGAKGFIGKNLCVALKRKPGFEVAEFDVDDPAGLLMEGLRQAEVIIHLAGVNRPERQAELMENNADLTLRICDELRRLSRRPRIVLSSSTQARLDNPYGISKRAAEKIVATFGHETGAEVFIFRFPGVFGKWSRPNYNSVVATFCHDIARDFPISVSDPARELDLVFVDDVVRTLIGIGEGTWPAFDGPFCRVEPVYRTTLGALAEKISGFRDSRINLILPDLSDPFIRALYATYISFLPSDAFSYPLTAKSDARGELAELVKSHSSGQFFISRTRPGITRGDHYHDTKVERFIVLEGEASIRFRPVLGGDLIEYRISGREFRAIDIPSGYTHAIENIGPSDLIVLMWADELFDPSSPDTHRMPVGGTDKESP